MLRYEYTCQKCGLELEFHKRVTVTKRRCPHCGELITPHEIDRQIHRRWLIGVCSSVGIGLLLLIISPFLPKDKDSSSRPNDAQVKADNETKPAADNAKPLHPVAKANDPKPDKFVPPKKDPLEEKLKKEQRAEEEKFKKEQMAEEERLKKERLAESDAKFRLASIKTLVGSGKPDVALRFAKDLVRLYPDTAEGKEAQAIIDRLTKKE